jgi:hypothetical protein
VGISKSGFWGQSIAVRCKSKTNGRRLLVMACSSRKTSIAEWVPAIDRYDGVMFRVVSRLRRLRQMPDDVDVVILSAKYGLLESGELIQAYDMRMTPEAARRQSDRNVAVLKTKLDSKRYAEVFISAGKTYLLALEPIGAWQKEDVPVAVNKGRIGKQLKTLKLWLLRSN